MRPLSIDALLAEHSLHEWGQAVYVPRNQLVTYVRFYFSHNTSVVRYISSGKFLNLTIYALRLQKRSRDYIRSPGFSI